MTALMTAIEKGRIHFVAEMLAAGADVNARSTVTAQLLLALCSASMDD